MGHIDEKNIFLTKMTCFLSISVKMIQNRRKAYDAVYGTICGENTFFTKMTIFWVNFSKNASNSKKKKGLVLLYMAHFDEKYTYLT